MDDVNAAENLVGLTLDTGWFVFEKLEKQPGDTGRFFSVCYKIRKESQICFLKAFNFAKFMHLSHSTGKPVQVVDVISEMVDAYRYERDLSALCHDKHVTKVAIVRDSGEQIVTGYPITLVPYLIFDLADGNIRSKLRFSEALDAAWKLKSLHTVATGIRQLHMIDVSHQDLKPSNILIFKEESKIGDLGRSTSLSMKSRHGELPFAGDRNYAPPEILYGQFEPDWRKRSFGADCYLFGSLVVYYFAGLSMNALLRKYLPDPVSWEQYRGPYEDVKGYVLDAFSKALNEIEDCIGDDFLRKELRSMVEYLCFPDPAKRGHPKGIGNLGNQYDMERIITRLDFVYRKFKYELSS